MPPISKNYFYLFEILKGRVREFFHPLGYSSNSCHSWGGGQLGWPEAGRQSMSHTVTRIHLLKPSLLPHKICISGWLEGGVGWILNLSTQM